MPSNEEEVFEFSIGDAMVRREPDRSLLMHELKAHRATMRMILATDSIHEAHIMCRKMLGGSQ